MKPRLVVGVAAGVIILVVVSGFLLLRQFSPPAPSDTGQQYWGTFYYPWYGGPGPDENYRHWAECFGVAECAHNPPSTWASMYLPDDGSASFRTDNLYSSKSPSTIGRHLEWMDRANLHFSAVSWWGVGTYEDDALAMILRQATSYRVRISIYYEADGGTDNPPVERIVTDLTHIYENRANFTSFFRVDEKPVVFVFGGVETVDYVNRWSQAKAQLVSEGKSLYIVLKVFQRYRSYASMIDGWHQYAPEQGYELQDGYSALVSPGYWEYPELAELKGRSRTSANLTRDENAFRQAVAKMASLTPSQAKFLLVETFNEFHEGSMIEPAFLVSHEETGFVQALPSYGFTYIDIIASRGA